MILRRWLLALLAITCVEAEPLRIVVLKIDGLPADTLNAALEARDPKTGQSRLPWIERVFIETGARANRFFVRGISLSAPSWAALDTGRPAEIRGNAEYDRYTMRIYDYLNFFPFYWRSALQRRVDMPGVEVLDDLGIPLIPDRFPARRKYTGFQLYQRGVRWKSLESALKGRFSNRRVNFSTNGPWASKCKTPSAHRPSASCLLPSPIRLSNTWITLAASSIIRLI